MTKSDEIDKINKIDKMNKIGVKIVHLSVFNPFFLFERKDLSKIAQPHVTSRQLTTDTSWEVREIGKQTE